MSEEKLIGRKDGGVGHITFNNPAKHNAVSLDMWVRFGELLEDPDVVGADGVTVAKRIARPFPDSLSRTAESE